MAFDMFSTFYEMDVFSASRSSGFENEFALCNRSIVRIGARFQYGLDPDESNRLYGDIDAERAFDFAAELKSDAVLEYGEDWCRRKLHELDMSLAWWADDYSRLSRGDSESGSFDDLCFQDMSAIILLVALENATEWKRKAFRSVIADNRQKGHQGWHVELLWWPSERSVQLRLLDSWEQEERHAGNFDRKNNRWGRFGIVPNVYVCYPEELP